jgi:hypothetical protein
MKNRKQFAHPVDMWDDDGSWSLGEGSTLTGKNGL